MPFAKKPKIRKVCGTCCKEVWLKPCKAKKFIFCSNKCKWTAKKFKIPHNKLPRQKRTFVKCTSIFCNRGKFLTPFQLKRRKQHFCGYVCYHYFRSKKYKLDIDMMAQRQQQDIKRSIWRI
jgi:hypothetical protein